VNPVRGVGLKYIRQVERGANRRGRKNAEDGKAVEVELHRKNELD